MKRWLAFLLLLITLAGSFYPCCMVDDCAADLSQTDQHQDADSGKGACSPFFACTSCAGFVIMDSPVLLPQPVVQKAMRNERVACFTPAEFYSSFWQPPRNC